jgi:hypothetical protein
VIYALALAVVLAQSPTVVDVDRASLVARDGGIIEVAGGAWLSTDQTLMLSRERARLKAENEALRSVPPSTTLIVVFFVIGLAVGGASVGIAVSQLPKN